MTLSDLQRAQLVLFAAREAGPKASLEEMKAICYCIRNRVRAGWFDGSWMACIEHAHETSAHQQICHSATFLDETYRPLQRLIRDIDGIYYGGGAYGELAGAATDGGQTLEDSIGHQKYWCFVNRTILPWFAATIIHDTQNHPSHAQMGLMMFYE